jgi:large subunit ribosomal protein L25
MSKKTEILKAEPRVKLGTRSARALRAQGQIPASMDGDATHPHLDLAIDEHEFLATRRRHTHVYELEFSGAQHLAVVRELQWDTFGERIVHIDFKRVQRDVKTEARVELEFTGHPKGGVLNHLITHLTVRCVPTLIPDSIEVPVGGLEMGGAIFGRDLKAPEGVDLLIHPDARIAVVAAAHVVVEAAPAAAEAAPAAGAVAPAGGAAPAAGTPPAAG